VVLNVPIVDASFGATTVTETSDRTCHPPTVLGVPFVLFEFFEPNAPFGIFKGLDDIGPIGVSGSIVLPMVIDHSTGGVTPRYTRFRPVRRWRIRQWFNVARPGVGRLLVQPAPPTQRSSQLLWESEPA